MNVETTSRNDGNNFDELFDRLVKAITKKYGSGIKEISFWKKQWDGKEDELLNRVIKLESENIS